MSKGHVYLIDDDENIRLHTGDLLRLLGFSVDVFEGAEAFLGLKVLRSPAVLLLDMRMPGVSGLELQSLLLEEGWEIPVVFLSGQSSSQEIIDSLKGGAQDFLLKPVTRQVLEAALVKAIAQHTQKQYRSFREHNFQILMANLSERERELFDWIVGGHTNKSIAEMVGVQAGTIKKHRAAIFEKMGVESTAELIALCRALDTPLT